MSIRRRFAGLFWPFACLGFGCSAEDQQSVPSAAVLGLAVCARDGACGTAAEGEGVADNTTPIRLHVFTPVVENRRSQIPVTIAATKGRFVAASPQDEMATVVDIGRSGGADVVWLPGIEPGEVRFEANWSGFRATATAELSAAPLGVLEVSPNPVFAPRDRAATVLLSIVVRGEAGASPSMGTVVTVRAESDAGSEIIAYPEQSEIDASFTVRPVIALPAGAEAARLTITATPPGSDPSAAVSSSLLIQRE